MKQYGKYLALAGIAGLGIFFSYLSAAAWGGMVLAKDNVMFYLEQPFSVEDALAVAEQNQETIELYRQGQEGQAFPFNFCIWGQKEDVIWYNEELSRSAEADVILLCGNPELVFEDCRMPAQEDVQGCLVDEKVAWELFGSVQAAGKEISWENNRFIIRNVIPGKEGIVAFQISGALARQSREQDGKESSQSLDEVMQRITLQRPAGYSIHDLESEWNSSYGYGAEALDMELLRGIGGCCVLLFPVSLCVLLWICLYHQYKNQRTAQGKAAAAGLSLALAALLLLFLKGQVKIPDDYIPTRWSEFTFWTTLWERKAEAARLLLMIPKSNLDEAWMDGFFKSVGYGLLAEALLVTAGVLAKDAIKMKKQFF